MTAVKKKAPRKAAAKSKKAVKVVKAANAAAAKKKAKDSGSLAFAKAIAKVASDHKAEELVILDMSGLASFTDCFVVCSGNSDTHVKALADCVREAMKKKGRVPIGEEGASRGLWALLDYGDVVLHVFYRPEREHYQLERLWYDAPRITIS